MQSAYSNDANSLSILRSLLLSSTDMQEIASHFLSLSSLHYTNPHLTLLILSCLKNVNIKGGDDIFQYMMSLYVKDDNDVMDMDISEDIDMYPLKKQLLVEVT